MNGILILPLAALVVLASVVSLVVALVALSRSNAGNARRADVRRRAADLPTDVEGLRAEVQALRMEAAQALRHLAVVRYDAFGDMGGHLSWSMALLDDGGDGVVLTSIHGRSEARTYAKNISDWSCEHALSPEEEEAVRFAKAAV
jgi:outer membrane murein-binding lipoprotein Lpp